MNTPKSYFRAAVAAFAVAVLAAGYARADQSDNAHTATRLVDTFVLALNTQDVSLFDKVFPENYIQHNPDVAPGLAGVKKVFAEQFKVVKAKHMHFHVAIEDIVVDGDRVVLRELTTVESNGKTYVNRSLDEWRVADGMLVEHWDSDSQMREVKHS